MRAPAGKRPRRWANKPQVMRLGKQLWAQDWETLSRPANRVYNWAMFLSDISTASRVGELKESTQRPKTGRGQKFKVRDCLSL